MNSYYCFNSSTDAQGMGQCFGTDYRSITLNIDENWNSRNS